MVICQGSTRSELPWGLLALCRRTLGSERHRYAIAWPDKLGTDPMAYGGFINGRHRGTRGNPVSKHEVQPENGDEQADAGRDGWTRLAKPNSQARTGTGEYYFPCSADHEQDWQPYPVDPYSAMCDDHTYVHTYGSDLGSFHSHRVRHGLGASLNGPSHGIPPPQTWLESIDGSMIVCFSTYYNTGGRARTSSCTTSYRGM